jgi:predicted transcriptional regulator
MQTASGSAILSYSKRGAFPFSFAMYAPRAARGLMPVFSRMLEGMEVHFTPELEAKVAESAVQQGRNPEELVQEVVARHFEEESRFIEAVKWGEEALQRGEYLTHEEVGQRLGRFLRP